MYSREFYQEIERVAWDLYHTLHDIAHMLDEVHQKNMMVGDLLRKKECLSF